MISGVVFAPSTPMLVPEVAAGAAGELAEVRAASIAALAELVATRPARIVVVGAASPARRHVGARREPEAVPPVRRLASGTGSLRGFGVPVDVQLDPAAPSQERLGLALTVGAWLLAQVGWAGERLGIEVGADADVADLRAVARGLADESGATVLLVVADGSASRSDKAPASLHPDAGAFDAAVATALRYGDPLALKEIERSHADAVTSSGWPAWQVAALATSGAAYDAELLGDSAPYGVGYLVARWLRA